MYVKVIRADMYSQQVNQERNKDSEYNEAEISSYLVINSVDNIDG